MSEQELRLRLYRVVNKGPNSWWEIAENIWEAIKQSFERGHARKIENLSAQDQTDFFLRNHAHRKSLRKVLQGNVVGPAFIKSPGGWMISPFKRKVLVDK